MQNMYYMMHNILSKRTENDSKKNWQTVFKKMWDAIIGTKRKIWKATISREKRVIEDSRKSKKTPIEKIHLEEKRRFLEVFVR